MHIRSKSLANFILFALEKAVDGYVRFEDFTYHHYRYHYGYPEIKKSSLAVALRRLRKGGLVKVDKNASEIIIRLTDLGKDALGELVLEDEKWDGKWRIVIFDIPEKHYVVRNLFRRRLKKWGFKNWQKSVWATKNNVTEKLRKLIANLDIKEWVVVIESDDPSLKNIF